MKQMDIIPQCFLVLKNSEMKVLTFRLAVYAKISSRFSYHFVIKV